MAWLFVDTHAQGRFRYAWLEAGKVLKHVEKEERAAGLLPLVAKDLTRFKITGVCVVKGPGSFSAVRSGVLDANLIARLLHVPLVPMSVVQGADLETVAQSLLTAATTVEYVAPEYDAEPNITIPKPA